MGRARPIAAVYGTRPTESDGGEPDAEDSDRFDRLDLQVLSALEVDARAPFSRIGAVLGVSDQTVARRFRRLSAEAGLRVVAVRDAERLGQDQWMLRLRCAPDSATVIADALAKRRDTAWIGLAVSGTEIVCMTRPRHPGDHDDLLLGKLPRTPSVVEIRAQQLLHRFYGGPHGWLRKFGALDADQIAALTPRFDTAVAPPASCPRTSRCSPSWNATGGPGTPNSSAPPAAPSPPSSAASPPCSPPAPSTSTSNTTPRPSGTASPPPCGSPRHPPRCTRSARPSPPTTRSPSPPPPPGPPTSSSPRSSGTRRGCTAT